MLARIDVGHHDVVVGPVQQNLTQELDRLALCDVGARAHEDVVVPIEEQVKVHSKILSDGLLVLCQDILMVVFSHWFWRVGKGNSLGRS